MQRRNFIFSSLFVIGCGLPGCSPLKNCPVGTSDLAEAFVYATQDLNLKNISRDLLLKIFSGKLSDDDRLELARDLVMTNMNLYFSDYKDRRFGEPGFYRVSP